MLTSVIAKRRSPEGLKLYHHIRFPIYLPVSIVTRVFSVKHPMVVNHSS